MELSNKFDDDLVRRTGKKAQENHDKIRFRLSSPSYVEATHSKSPQAVFKITSFAKGASVRKVMEYITRTDRDEIGIPAETEDGTQLHGKEDVQKVYEDWAVDFERKKAGRKTDPRHATHIILAAKTDNSKKSVQQVHRAASNFLRKEFGDLGYQYAFVVHKDTENPHVHVVLKNKNNLLNKKLRLGKADLFALRQEFAKSLTEQGIQHESTLRRDRPEIVQQVAKQLDTMRNRSIMVNERLKKAETPAMNTFETRRFQLLGIQSAKKQIQKNTFIFSKKRHEMVKQLNAVQTAIVKNDPVMIKKHVEATIKYFEKDNKEVAKKLTEVMEAKKPVTKLQRKERKQRAEIFNQYSDKYVKGIKAAMKDIKSDLKIPESVKKPALMKLKQQQKSVEKLKAKGLSLGL